MTSTREVSTMPETYEAHCSVCHRDAIMRLAGPSSARCTACGADQVVHPCLVLGHAFAYDDVGDVVCLDEGRVVISAEYEAIMDALPLRNRIPGEPCCTARGLRAQGFGYAQSEHRCPAA